MNEVANNPDAVSHRSATQSLRCCNCERFPRPKKLSKRGVCFLVGGLAGGTALVAVASFAFDNWAYLSRWLSGLAAVVVVSAYVVGKKWMVGVLLSWLNRIHKWQF